MKENQIDFISHFKSGQSTALVVSLWSRPAQIHRNASCISMNSILKVDSFLQHGEVQISRIQKL